MLAVLLIVGFAMVMGADDRRSSLSNLWLEHSAGPVLHRWLEFSDAYQESLESFHYGAKRLVMLEIGVQSGGSMLNWVNWFKDVENFVYVGLDVNPLCKDLDVRDDDSIHIEIGSQLDVPFLQSLCSKYGPFDIIIDDGGHTVEMMTTSLRALFPCMTDIGYYFIEDTMTIASNDWTFSHYQNRTLSHHLSDIFTTMHNFWSVDERFYDPIFSGHLKSIQLVDSLVVLERAPVERYIALVGGAERIPYDSFARLQISLGNNQILNLNVYVAESSNNIPHESIKAECRSICAEYPSIRPGLSVEECAVLLKQDVIIDVFKAPDDYLFGDEPIRYKPSS